MKWHQACGDVREYERAEDSEDDEEDIDGAD